MEQVHYRPYISRLIAQAGRRRPFDCNFALTYRCNLRCGHCYCRGSENAGVELSTARVKAILDKLVRLGCVTVTFTGGEPLLRDDFLEIYFHARRRGLLVGIFTNAQLLDAAMLRQLRRSPPLFVEITLNALTRRLYEEISGVQGSFAGLPERIRRIARQVPVSLKAVCLRRNKGQLRGLQRFSLLLGAGRDDAFKLNYIIMPRMNGDPAPLQERLRPEELIVLRRQGLPVLVDIDDLGCHACGTVSRESAVQRRWRYRCRTWVTACYIDPFGQLRFCPHSSAFSADLNRRSLSAGFYRVFPRVWHDRTGRGARCNACELRKLCYNCAVRARLETGDPDAAVPYYCALARSLGGTGAAKKGARDA